MESNLLQRLHVVYAKLQRRVFGKRLLQPRDIATCLGVLSYCRLKRAPLSSYLIYTELPLENRFGEDRHKHCKVL